jgi:hypothetical protein
MERGITVLSGMTTDEATSLVAQGIVCGDDLTIVTFADITEILTDASVVKHQKLSLIGSYLALGRTIDEATTVPTIVEHLNTPVTQANNPNPPDAPPPYPRLPLPPPPRLPEDPDRGALKLYSNLIEKFLGYPINFEDWEKKTRSILGQTAYAAFLEGPPMEGDLVAEKRNLELYNMFVTAVMDGSGMYILNGIIGQDGHAA